MGYDGTITIGTRIDTKGVDSGLASLEKTLDKRTNAMANATTKTFKLLKTTIIAVGIGLAIREITKELDGAVERLDTMKNYTNVMSNLGIGSEDAESSINRLQDALDGLPTTLDDAALSVQRLTSANGNIKASTEMFLALNNAILAGGAPMATQSAALEQLSQAYAKGKPDMMEWRTALQAMPAQLTQVAKVMGFMSSDQLGQALRSGKISMNDFMVTLIKMNKEGINGFKSLEEQARNATGGISTSIQNVKTAIQRALANIMDAIGRENITAFFQNIIKAINAVAPYIAAFVKLIMMAISSLAALFGGKKSSIGAMGSRGQEAADTMKNLGSASAGASKDIDNTTSSTKKLNKELKTLAAFDEMNVLNEKTSNGGFGTGTSGSALGDLSGVDLSAFDDLEKKTNSFIDNVEKIKEKMLSFLQPLIENWELLTGAILGSKVGLELFSRGFDGLKSLGIGLIITGLITAIISLIEYLKNPSFKNFGKVIEGIGIAIIGLGLIVGGLPVIITGAAALIYGIIIKYWNEIRDFLQKGIDWLTGKSDWVHKYFGDTIGNVYDFIVRTLQNILNYFNTVIITIRSIFNGIIKFVKGVFTGDWKLAWQGIKQIFFGVFDLILARFTLIFNIIKDKVVTWAKTVGSVIGNVFKAVVNGVLNAVENILNTPIRAINGLIKVINKVPGINMERLSTFKLPRLAKGGIINQPGRGVMLGSAIGGEAGPEAVLPLDDVTMDRLGSSIAKHMTINATLINQMNGRVISKELQKINNESDFAFNR